ncbi:MAG: DegT/DnrJ/EryC1/StrS family aminotransferase [Desulfobulbaceae bacterium]|nr:DegT/DnrJ/EryC1/StrS family aminotransferase [Desulfobulbaceae bacterium]
MSETNKPQPLPFTRPTIGPEELEAVRQVLESGWLASGPKVLAFEQALSDYLGNQIPVRVFNSGTSALEACLLAADIGPGDEVIVPAMSFVATANVVGRVGAKPVFVDVDLYSRNLSAASVAPAITARTKAIIPVHFGGLAVDLDPIYQLAASQQLIVIEDGAQAIGTGYRGRKIGAVGNPVCFSFHPNKNLTTIEGGAVACSDPQFIKRLERLRFHGIERDAAGNIDVPEWGGKMNLPDVGAALGLAQLAKLDGFNRQRRQLAERYLATLPNHPLLVKPADGEGHSWHLFCVCIDHQALGTSRAALQARMQEDGITVGIHYPAMPLFSMYQKLGNRPGDFPVAERIGMQTLTLPLFPAMTLADVERVVAAIAKIING